MVNKIYILCLILLFLIDKKIKLDYNNDINKFCLYSTEDYHFGEIYKILAKIKILEDIIMTFRLNHMCSNVRDMDANIAFYTNVLGGQVTSYQIIEPIKAKYVYVQVAEQLIELIEPGVHDENTTYGLTHIAYETENLDEAYKYICDLGYKFHVPPKNAASGNGRIAFFKDTNGITVELLQRDRTMYRTPIKSPIVCELDHYAVQCQDLKAAHKLYHEQLGMENLAHFVVGDNIREIMYLGSGTDTLEIVESSAYKADENPHSHIAFRVENIAEACVKLRERGIEIPEDDIKVPGIQTGMTVSIKDPEGIRIEFVDRPSLRKLAENGITVETLSTMRPF